MSEYNIIISDNQTTVAAEYAAEYHAGADYQSEARSDRDFVGRLQAQGYEHVDIRSEAGLIANLRK